MKNRQKFVESEKKRTSDAINRIVGIFSSEDAGDSSRSNFFIAIVKFDVQNGSVSKLREKIFIDQI